MLTWGLLNELPWKRSCQVKKKSKTFVSCTAVAWAKMVVNFCVINNCRFEGLHVIMDLLPWPCGSQKESTNRLASITDMTSGLQPGKAEVLRWLRNVWNIDRPEHHSTDHRKERGGEKGSGDVQPSGDRNDLFLARPALGLFWGQLGETAERWGRAHMGLSKRYSVMVCKDRTLETCNRPLFAGTLKWILA